jgi:Zn-dependent alcohol dehydrogenase
MATLLSSCGKCRWCLKGLTHLCENVFAKPQGIRLTDGQGKPVIQKAGVGGFAEYILVYETQIVKVPDGIPLDRAALLSCEVMTGFGAVVNRAKVPALSSVVVIGTGGVGLNALQAAAFSGADPVIAVDVVDSKLEDSKKFGATHGVNARSADAAEQVKAITGGQGADFVFVTVGSAAAIKQGFAMSGVRGTTVIVGIPPATETFTFSAFDFLTSERVLTAGFMGSTNIKSDMPKLFSLYKSGKLKLDELITNRYPLAQINEAIENTIQGKALRNVIIFK